MAQFVLSQRTAIVSPSQPAWEIRAGAANKPRILEIGFTQVTVQSGVYGLGRPAAVGVLSSPVTVLDESDGAGPVGQTTAAVAWTTQPTAPAQFFRRVAMAPAAGQGVIWTFPRGLAIPAGGSIVIWNLALAATLDAYCVVDE